MCHWRIFLQCMCQKNNNTLVIDTTVFLPTSSNNQLENFVTFNKIGAKNTKDIKLSFRGQLTCLSPSKMISTVAFYDKLVCLNVNSEASNLHRNWKKRKPNQNGPSSKQRGEINEQYWSRNTQNYCFFSNKLWHKNCHTGVTLVLACRLRSW